MNASTMALKPAGAAVIDRVKRNLVGLKMPRALEVLDVALRGIERGETTALEAIDILLAEEVTLRENRRVKMALQMARLSAVKTLAGFDFSFQPSLDRNRIMALAGLQFIDRAEAVHLIGPPGTGSAWPSASRPSKPAAPPTLVRSLTSSPRSRRRNAKEPCARRSDTSAASLCSLSTRSATCR